MTNPLDEMSKTLSQIKNPLARSREIKEMKRKAQSLLEELEIIEAGAPPRTVTGDSGLIWATRNDAGYEIFAKNGRRTATTIGRLLWKTEEQTDAEYIFIVTQNLVSISEAFSGLVDKRPFERGGKAASKAPPFSDAYHTPKATRKQGGLYASPIRLRGVFIAYGVRRQGGTKTIKTFTLGKFDYNHEAAWEAAQNFIKEND